MQRLNGIERRTREAVSTEDIATILRRLDRIEALIREGSARPREKAAPAAPVRVVIGREPEPVKADGDEILHGYDAIGQAMDGTADQARSWARAGLIPTFKMGRKACARRSSLMAALAAREASAALNREA